MDLRERLDWAFGLTRKAPSPVPSGGEAGLATLPWGEVTSTPHGRCVHVVESYPLEYTHGFVALREVLAVQPRTLGALDAQARRPYALPDELCFLDSETTGLAGGSGTVPFLVGVGYVTDRSFVIEQFFARDFDEEPAVLFLACQILRQRPKWISYNGKAFDAQLLAQRMVFHRLGDLPTPDLHVDLLFAVRRLWKGALAECSLGQVEENLLGLRRDGDLPSWLVPRVYFQYLRDKDPWPLRPVFEHNRADILSLVGLLAICARTLERPEHAPPGTDLRQAARMLWQRGRYSEAESVLRAALDKAATARGRKTLMLELARIYKAERKWPRCVELWHEALRLPGLSLEPYVELAKFYEHRALDLAKAELLTRQALEHLRILAQLHPHPKLTGYRSDLERRLSRLLRKQGKM
ncbi:MAG: ribonuclease H-like domain-containing protein [candidate division KSB1 bacterium]|nr:ribonuclease H-like domain-containing protein [candidate division KSB1 bacterium]